MAKKQLNDRRIARTKATLQHALISLTLKKGYDATTIKDICDEANVGRSTFYAHFTSKDDLKRSGLENLRKLLVARQRDALAASDGETRSLSFSLSLFEHARDHKELYRALAGSRGGAIGLSTIRQILSDLVRDEIGAAIDKSNADAIPRDLVVEYLVGAYMAVLIWWLDRGAKLPPQRIDAMFRLLASKGVRPPYS